MELADIPGLIAAFGQAGIAFSNPDMSLSSGGK
jgi:hypothetical protein